MNKAWSKDKDSKEEEEDCEPCKALKIFKSSRPLLSKTNTNNNNTTNTTTNTNSTTPINNSNNSNNSNNNNNNNNNNIKENDKIETPPDLLELGRSTWTLMHTIAAYYPDHPTPQKKENVNSFIHDIANVFPCNECATDFKEVLKVTPPKLDSRQELGLWMCQAHNHVNQRLGKEPFDCSKVDERWRYNNSNSNDSF